MRTPTCTGQCSSAPAHVQVVTEYKDSELDSILELTERMEHHLTAAVVSNDMQWLNKVPLAFWAGTDVAAVLQCAAWQQSHSQFAHAAHARRTSAEC